MPQRRASVRESGVCRTEHSRTNFSPAGRHLAGQSLRLSSTSNRRRPLLERRAPGNRTGGWQRLRTSGLYQSSASLGTPVKARRGRRHLRGFVLSKYHPTGEEAAENAARSQRQSQTARSQTAIGLIAKSQTAKSPGCRNIPGFRSYLKSDAQQSASVDVS